LTRILGQPCELSGLPPARTDGRKDYVRGPFLNRYTLGAELQVSEPFVELYGSCMVVLKVAWCGIDAR
jgi:hypothetical protein